MSITTFSTDFQGQPTVDGPLDEACLDQLRREAFPLAPPFDPSVVGSAEAPWRSYKLAPVSDQRLLVSVASERGHTDGMGRPVSSATGCILSIDDLDGPLRDIGSLWRALDHLSAVAPPTQEALVEEVTQASPLCSDAAFAELASRYRERGAFYAAAAATLSRSEGVDVVLPMDAGARRHLLPVMLLIPLDSLMRLHLATGSQTSDHRERVLGVERAPARPRAEPSQKSGLLGGLFSRSPPPEPVQASPLVDFRHSRVTDGPAGEGPLWLTRLGAQDSQWPGLSARERFGMILRTGDAKTLGVGHGSLFSRPEFSQLRRLMQEVEQAEAGLKTWH